MNSIGMIRNLYQHHDWATDQTWVCVDALTEAQYRQPIDYSIGSVEAQMFHVAYWEHFWFASLKADERISRDTMPTLQDYPNRDALKTWYGDNRQLVWDVLDNQTDETIQQNITETRKVWQILIQMYGHAFDHRAQILAGIYPMGAPTFEQNFFSFLHNS